ncbi:MAG: hypothetical protein JW754_01250 [Candidatus Aenigmarchaeota archaeon]|nr:hypothetical protein [Candidatus Aenigmarchaeota archaeon]
MNHSKKIITATMVISIFILALSIISWYIQLLLDAGTICSCAIPLPILIPVIASMGLLIGTFIYYLFTPSPECKVMDKNLLRILFSGEEAVIMEKLTESNGNLTQARLVNSTGIPKVRVFRALERMKSKGIIEKEPQGKTNMIRINPEIGKLFIQ